jgi:hypothetical protein
VSELYRVSEVVRTGKSRTVPWRGHALLLEETRNLLGKLVEKHLTKRPREELGDGVTSNGSYGCRIW